jgi:ElaB/YqjD/DUF883 family membrane-anchored ribosome-binding protein
MREEVLDAKLDTKKEGFFNGAIKAAELAAQTGLKVERLKERAAHAIEDGMTDARRMVKRGRYAAEDLVDDTAHLIKKDPWASVGITFGAGLGLGVLVGWLVGHKKRVC